MKKSFRAIVFIICIAFLAGCSLAKTGEIAPAAEDYSSFIWEIQVKDSLVTDRLHTDEGVQQYDGSTLNVAHDDIPAEGSAFLILTMTITKNKTGGGSFKWDNLYIADEGGAKYQRMENDRFLSYHTFNRLPGTPLQIGENKGSICFEIPASATKGKLTLCYDAGDEGVVSIPLK